MLTEPQQRQYLGRIEQALRAGHRDCDYATLRIHVTCVDRGGRDVVTEVDRRLSDELRADLLRNGEGWLSEEDPDDRIDGCPVTSFGWSTHSTALANSWTEFQSGASPLDLSKTG